MIAGFIIGLFVGGAFGVIAMSILQINRDNRDDEEED